jgi:hypothetical protein
VNGTSDGRIAERAETNPGGCCGGGKTSIPEEARADSSAGLSAGHSMGAHLLHMPPMVLILLGPRIGWTWTGLFLGVVGVYYLWRRQTRTSRDAFAVVESGGKVNSDIEG